MFENRQQGCERGCSLFSSDQIQVEKLNFDRDTKSFEMICITISNMNSKTELINIGTILFRPP